MLFFLLIAYNAKAQSQFDLLKVQYDSLRAINNIPDALKITKQMNQWALENEGDTSLNYAVSFRYIGNCFENNDSALFYYKLSKNYLEKKNRTRLPDYGRCIHNLGLNSLKSGDSLLAINYFNQALEIYDFSNGKKNKDYINTLNALVQSYNPINQTKEIESILIKILNIHIDMFGYENNYTVGAIYNLADFYSKYKNYAEAEALFVKLVELNTKLFGKESIELANSNFKLGNNYWNTNKIDSAIYCYESTKTIISNKLKYTPEDNSRLTYLQVCKNLIDLYNKKNDTLNVDENIGNAISISKNIYGESNKIHLELLLTIAQYYFESIQILKAKNIYELCNTVLIKHSVNNYDLQLDCFFGLNQIYYKLQDYSNAELICKKALEEIEKTEGNNSLNYANMSNNLGAIYTETNEFDEAEYFLLKAYKIKVKSDDKEYIITAEINLSRFYGMVQYYPEAIEHLEKAYGLQNELNLRFTDNYISTLLMLASYNLLYNKEEEGIGYLDFAESMCKKVYQNESEVPISFHNMFGSLYYMLNNIEKSKYYLNKIIDHDIKSINNDSIRFIDYKQLSTSLYSMILICMEEKDYNVVENYFLKFDNIKSGITNETIIRGVLEQKIDCYYHSSKSKEFITEARDYLSQISNHLKLYEGMMVKGQFNIFVTSAEDYLNLIKKWPLYNKTNHEITSQMSFNTILLTKGILLNNELELWNKIKNIEKEDVRKIYKNYKILKDNIDKIVTTKEYNDFGFESNLIEAAKLEKQLLTYLPQLSSIKNRFSIQYKDVRSILHLDDAAIEFTKYYDDVDSSCKYMAQVLRSNYEYPYIVKLGSEKEIEKYKSGNGLSELYHLVWEPIDSLLEGVKTVYYSPDGLLYSVPFHALCTNDTAGCSYLMDKYTLHQLSTTRYLADSTLINTKPLNNTISLYGGINYEMVNDTNKNNQEETNEDYLFANTLKRETTFKAVDYLPGTKQEVESVVPLFNKNKWNTTIATGSKASEQLFKSYSDTLAPSIIHIATHGFAFLDKEDGKKKNKMDMLILSNNQQQYTAAEDPMMRCGLMFAGANKSWTGKQKEMIEQTGQDGILTAAEVANMDLSNTKLVVLSACETGLGKVEGSEGVFGLQRGFKLAGVEQLIVSLWKVPDHETMELMNLFYSDLTITKDPVISFSKAQKQMRNNYPDNPEKWAGFVLVR